MTTIQAVSFPQSMEDQFTDSILRMKMFLEDNASEIAAHPKIAPVKATFNDLADKVIYFQRESLENSDTYQLYKSKKEKELTVLMLQISNAISRHAITENNDSLRKHGALSSEELEDISDISLYYKAMDLHNQVLPIQYDLKNSGATAGDVAILKMRMEQYLPLIPSHTEKFEEHHEYGQNVDAVFHETDEVLTTKMDLLMKEFEVSNSTLYNQYKNLRTMSAQTSQEDQAFEGMVNPGETKVITTLTYREDRTVNLQNTGLVALIFELRFNGQGTTENKPITLQPESSINLLLRDLANSGNQLVVVNTDVNTAGNYKAVLGK